MAGAGQGGRCCDPDRGPAAEGRAGRTHAPQLAVRTASAVRRGGARTAVRYFGVPRTTWVVEQQWVRGEGQRTGQQTDADQSARGRVPGYRPPIEALLPATRAGMSGSTSSRAGRGGSP